MAEEKSKWVEVQRLVRLRSDKGQYVQPGEVIELAHKTDKEIDQLVAMHGVKRVAAPTASKTASAGEAKGS